MGDASSSKPLSPSAPSNAQTNTTPLPNPSPPVSTSPPQNSALAARMARFKALQSAKSVSNAANREATQLEAASKKRDHELASKLQRIQERTEVKMMRDEDREGFERKRAWDYTIDESESWDRRVTKKKRNKDNNAFQDWRMEANKVYKRQVKQMGKVDLEEYTKERAEKLQRQVQNGLLELVEDENGEVFTVDKQGRINTPVEESYNCDHKPTKEAIDRLVNDLEKGERARLEARRKRGLNDDDRGDVTYINQKNKQFNEKLARFYNRYTTEIRESFERGTAI
ncbi:pre-mRNA splicing factor syf2 [Lojkania enalia]|uniref:Pre-mRNA-splicing factor SYF2 n=1 Tax=Lojkania enalia TaxID=147567 RepID=A0A9P4MX22_9PLEO|nr:pre-mRNA splicing factor syf2 [Didymosphaeria enalia]